MVLAWEIASEVHVSEVVARLLDVIYLVMMGWPRDLVMWLPYLSMNRFVLKALVVWIRSMRASFSCCRKTW